MKLLARFNLIFVVVFGIGLAVAVWLAYMFLRNDAKRQVMQQAKLIMETSLATRSYTITQLEPLLAKLQRRDSRFLPQTIPFYASTQVFDYIHKRNPDYSYKEAALNPTNPVDRTADWEADIVRTFRNDPSRTEIFGERPTPTGISLYFARPIQVSNAGCLQCHSSPDRAPAAILREYGRDNGFGWKLNEIVGAQIVSVPESLTIAMADRALKTLVAYLAVVALVTLLFLDLVLIVTVIRPVAKLSRMADEISQGRLDVEDLPIRGRDEISVLASSFNRMQRSLARAMRMLETDAEGHDGV
jgi:protein-histidine pros-kinase